MYKRAAASICLPVDADGPVIGRMSPILNASCAHPELTLNKTAKATNGNIKRVFKGNAKYYHGEIYDKEFDEIFGNFIRN
jgi:hypothetical protein